MKKVFIFDKAEQDYLNADESTVVKETGVNAANVKELTMMKIRNEKKTKKTSVKKIFAIAAIAAAITAAAAISVQAATGVFNPAFAELFSGQPAEGVFPGADITTKSDALNIEFGGVAGTDQDFLAVYEITKKDGSSFVENSDSYIFLGSDAEMNVSESVWKQMMLAMNGTRGMGSGVTYEFVDDNTIRAYVSCSDTAGYLKGARLEVTDTETTIWHIDEVLYRDTALDYMGCTDYMEQNEEMLEQKNASLESNQTIMPVKVGKYNELAVLTYTKIPFEYELGVTLNYKSTNRVFSSSVGTQFSALDSEWTIKEFTANSFSIELTAETNLMKLYEDYDVNDMDNWSAEKQHDYMNISTEITLEITKKDGTKLYAISAGGQGSFDSSNKGTMMWHFNYMDDNSKPCALNASDIASITCNGTKLF